MKQVMTFAIAATLLVGASFARAEEIKSGLQAGADIGPFYVTKCAGAEEDGVEVGRNLCYRCKNGSRPRVMVFTRSTDAKVVDLVKGLDAQIAKNSEQQLRGFVNCLSDSKEAAMEEAKKLATEAKADNVPFVVPNEFENGPEDYGLSDKAEVTVIIAKKGEVIASHAFGKGADVQVDAVLADVAKALN